MRTSWTFVTLLGSWLLAGAANGAEPEPGEAEFALPTIRVADGFTVELAAAPPLVRHPLMANFDDRGRLFIAESAGENLGREELEKRLPNFIRMLEDTNGDGRFDKSTIFADRMTMPQGALWHDGALYVAAPPNIWRLQDTTGDGVADRRDVLVDRFGYTGNAADIHGCFLGPEGRVYWCDGRHGHEFRNEQGEIVSQGKAARIFSCRPDGSDVQVHCGGGMDNPVEVDFLPTGEMIGTANLFYRKRGDCLVHWMRGGVYPRHDQPQCIAEFPSTGDLLGPVHDYGHVAVSGLTRFRGDGFGDEYRDNWFVTHFNTHKVVRTRLARQGATFAVSHQDEEFLSSDSIDFHPTDVLQDADGSLLVIDTGGWFRIGCPTSQIAKPNILGAIYRVRRTGVEPVSDPRGMSIAWDSESVEQLVSHVSDPRFAVRERASAALAQRGDSAVAGLAAIAESSPGDSDYAAIWSLSRIATESARAAVRRALASSDAGVRSVAAFSAGANRDRQAASALLEMLADNEPAVRRTAATALGQIGDAAAVPGLLRALGEPSDRFLEHALIYALIEIADSDATAAGLDSDVTAVQKGALIALDQMRSSELTPEQVAPLLASSDLNLRTAALAVVARRPDWAAPAAEAIRDLLDRPTLDERGRESAAALLIAFLDQPAVRDDVGRRLDIESTPMSVRAVLLDAIAGSDSFGEMSEAWQRGLKRCLADDSTEIVGRAIDAVAAVGVEPFRDTLLGLSDDADRPIDLRLAALATASAGQPVSAPRFELLARQVTGDTAPGRRLTAARAIGASQLTPEQFANTLHLIERAGPLELAALLEITQTVSDETAAGRLLEVLAAVAGRTPLPPSLTQPLIERFPSAAQPHLGALVPAASTDVAAQAERLEELERNLPAGDPGRGRAVFFGQRTACFACHRIGDEGARVGPDLSTIGQRRSARDLLEAIVYPSASLARGYESYTVVTDDGRVLAGMVVRETTDAVLLRTADQREVRIARNAMETITPSPLSIMPAGLEKMASEQELADLLAYLRTRGAE